MRVLLDTNAYTALLRGHSEVAGLVRRSEEVLISPVVAGELLFGFRNGTRYEANRRQLDAFLDSPFVRFYHGIRATSHVTLNEVQGLVRKVRCFAMLSMT